jgi:quercetin dioxygenase-like cupin family protein
VFKGPSIVSRDQIVENQSSTQRWEEVPMTGWIRTRNAVLVLSFVAAGITAYAAIISESLANGLLPYSESIGGPAAVSFQKLTIPPGDQSAWHYHTGEVTVVVQSGTLSARTPCGGVEIFGTGQAFQEEAGEIHRVFNAGTEPVVLYAAYVVPAGAPRSVNVTEPICIGPPVSSDECKADNWQTFTVPRVFKNEGDCVSWVESGHRP